MNSVQKGLGRVSSPIVGGLSRVLGRTGADPAKRDKCKGIKPRVLATEPTTITPHSVPTEDEIEHMIQKAVTNSGTLKSMSVLERHELALACVASCKAATHDLVTESIKFKGSYETGRGEETIAWSATIGTLRELAESLLAIHKNGGTLPEQATSTTFDKTDNRHKAVVFPRGLYQHMLFAGYSAELWFKDAPEVDDPMSHEKEAWLLLGAGNQATVVGCDVAQLVFAHGASVVCKLNAVNDYLLPHFEKAFKPLVDKNIVQFCYVKSHKVQLYGKKHL